jgi:glycosyltransferase involved in cell wall biosynthesis
MPEIVLSILICSLNKRFGMLGVLLRNLEHQIKQSNAEDLVEVLVNADGGEKSTGRKRNELLKQAKGRMIVYHDDDDEPSDCYVSEILKALRSDPDAIGFCGTMSTNDRDIKKWFISKDLQYRTCKDSQGNEFYERYNNHISPTRRTIAMQIGFPDLYQFEDFDYAKRLHESNLIKTEVIIQKPLYHYRFKTVK